MDNSKNTWQPIILMPSDKRYYLTKISDDKGDRNFTTLKRENNLFFLPSGMYVYYSPTHFKKL